MEKHTPHCKLQKLHALVLQGKLRVTGSAVAGASALGMSRGDITTAVLALSPRDFYKSMTTHRDHQVWQDVYLPRTWAGVIYLKLIVIDDVLVVSFKEK